MFTTRPELRGPFGMVSSTHWLASQTGMAILERGGTTPWTPPAEMREMGYSMVLYPASLLFRQTAAIRRGLADLKAGRPMPADDSVDMFEFEKIVDIAYWKLIEQKYVALPERVRQGLNKLFKKVA